MSSIRIKPSLLTLLLSFLFSCTVKEDRSACPCLLTVDLSKSLDAGITPPSLWDRDLQLFLFPESGEELRQVIRYEEAEPEYVFRVAKGDVGVSGVLGLDSGIVEGCVWTLPEGVQSDGIYVSSDRVSCLGEEARTVLEMNKQFVNVEITGLDSLGRRMEVTAACSGLDLLSCEAVPGRFRCPLACEADGVCRFRLPRQSGNDILILLYDETGRLDNRIPLGLYLEEIHYDWSAPSLTDVSLYIDRVMASVSISVSGWTYTIEFPYTI